MPNWTNTKTTIVAKSKEALDNFIASGKLLEGEDRFEDNPYSFESFMPMPEIYRKYDTTNYPNGEKLVVGQKTSFYENSPVATSELIEEYKAATKEQEEKYGAIGWYNWSVKYWGTKWDTGFDIERTSDNTAEIFTETAWSAPINFFKTLSERFPDLKFTLEAHYEYPDNEVLTIENGVIEHKDSDVQALKDYILNKVNNDDNFLEDREECLQKTAIFVDDNFWYCYYSIEENYYEFLSFCEWYEL